MSEPLSISEQFRTDFLASPNQLGFSITTLLAWIATCDGELAPDEEARLAEVAQSGPRPIDHLVAIRAAKSATAEDLQLACEVVRHLGQEKRCLLLDMALGVSLADHVLRPAENHVLRFLADMLGLGAEGLQSAWKNMTGGDFPHPPDLSSAEHWDNESGDNSRSNGNRRQQRTDGSAGDSQRKRALAVLGLEENAAASEITLAYRRLAKIHHPDRFQVLGPEAVRAATETFQRIQSAYECLRS